MDIFSIAVKGNIYNFCKIPKGSFIMGANDFLSNAAPPHKVEITRDFYMLETAVTQRLWHDLMGTDIEQQLYLKGSDKLYGVGDNLPMYYVSWFEVNNFITRFNKRLQVNHPLLTADLPTEAQWEYACRATTYTPYYWGDSLNGMQANCNGNYPYGMYEIGPFVQKVLPVKSFPPNSWGLYEMLGNVWEWCKDNYAADYYAQSPVKDPQGATNTERKVIRGGGWRSYAWCCRSAFRDSDPPDYRGRTLGFRIIIKEKI